MIPEMAAVPGVGGLVPFPAEPAENVVRGSNRKSAFGKSPIRRFQIRRGGGRFAPGRKLAFDEVEERKLTLGEICYFRRPIIHLDVDVGVVIRMPRWIVAVIPQPLEIGGQPSGTGAGNEQVTTILKEKLLELGIDGVDGQQFALVSRQGALRTRGIAEMRRNAIEHRLKILQMRGLEPGIAGSRSSIYLHREPSVRVCPTEIILRIPGIISSSRHEQGQGVAI